LALAGSALFVAAQQVDQRSEVRGQRLEIGDQILEVSGQILTEEEIAQINNYDNFMAISAKVEPTPAFVPIPTAEPKQQVSQIVEKLPLPQMTAEGAQLIDKYKAELPTILEKIKADPQQTEDLTIYYPIYRAAQDKTGVSWYLIWIIHEDESTVSRNANAFILGAAHYGAMQRAVQFHPDSDIERASADYAFLGGLPQRHFDDWREIVWGATAIDEYIEGSGSILGGLKRYSASGPAVERFRRFIELEALLEQ
jgi:hypothetical protein